MQVPERRLNCSDISPKAIRSIHFGPTYHNLDSRTAGSPPCVAPVAFVPMTGEAERSLSSP